MPLPQKTNLQKKLYTNKKLFYTRDKNKENVLLGFGAFGQVFQGYINNNRGKKIADVAIKKVEITSKALASLKYESDIYQALGKHANIPTFYQFNSNLGILVMEMMQDDLFRVIEKNQLGDHGSMLFRVDLVF
jgi:serine/threonine protein kinase